MPKHRWFSIVIVAVDRGTVQSQVISMFEPHGGSNEHEPGKWLLGRVTHDRTEIGQTSGTFSSYASMNSLCSKCC